MAHERHMDDATLTAHFVTIEAKLDALSDTQADVLAEIGNVPRRGERFGRKTVTDRLHGLEAQTSATAFDAAIERVLRRRRATFWTTTQKLFIFGFAALGALGTLLRIVGWHG